MTSRQLDEERIFHTARLLPNADAQADYLDQVCGGDQALRERVEALLAVNEQEQSFLKSEGEPAPTADQPSVTEAPGQQIGRYKLLQQIGEGGFGVVYMAEQSRPVRRKVALKIIKPGMDTRAVIARFEAERQALALMDHPHIARVFDGNATDSGRPYFVMELVKGVPITEYCDKNQVPTGDRLRLFITVCQAVQHAHQKGIIHRDLKPSNILVTLHDGEPMVKVIDFGVAKAINQQLTEKTLFTAYGQMVGTPQYMSPEQAEMSGLDVDTRSDIFSLGVLLFELLTGTTPLESKDLFAAGYAELQRLIQEEEPPKPSTRLSSSGEELTIIAKHHGATPERLHKLVRGDLDWIVMKALEKDRARRYVTVSSFADDIRRYMNDEVVYARAPSSTYRLRKFVQRNRGRVVAASLLGLLLVGGSIGTTTGWIAAIDNRRELQKRNDTLIEQARTLVKQAATLEQQSFGLAQRNRQLQSLTERYGDELFKQALTASMSASESTEELIREAEIAGVVSWKLEMLRGQHALYTGDPERAVEILTSARDLAGEQGVENLAIEAALTTAYLDTGLLEEWIFQSDHVDGLDSSEKYAQLLKAQAYLALPSVGLNLLEAAFPSTGPQSGLSLAVRARLRAANATRFGKPDSALQALEDAHAATLIMGESPFALQVELICCAAAMAVGKQHAPDSGRIETRAKELTKKLEQNWSDYATGAYSRSYYELAIENFEGARAALQRAAQASHNPVYIAGEALTVYQSGATEYENVASTLIDELDSSWDRALIASTLADSKAGRELARKILEETLGKANGSFALRISAAHLLLSLGDYDRATEQAKLGLKAAGLLPTRDNGQEPRTWRQWSTKVAMFIAEEISQEDLLAYASSNYSWRCDAYLVIARKQISQRHLPDALESLKRAVEHPLPWQFHFQIADGLRKRVETPERFEWLNEDS